MDSSKQIELSAFKQ
jgi:regulator of replication initiation timing